MYLDVSTIEREYEQKRLNAQKDNEERIKEIYLDFPELTSIESEIRKLGIEASKKALLSSSDDSQKAVSVILEKIEKLKDQKEKLLAKKGISLLPKYECEKCNDTGYVTINNKTQMCTCMKQRLIDDYYNKFNNYKLNNETF